jgi:hypothetical protein
VVFLFYGQVSSTLLSLVQILRALEQLTLFENFEVKPLQLSPLQLAKLEHSKRHRASRKKGNVTEKPKSTW